ENLQTQLDNNIYISDPDSNNIVIELYEEEIVEGIQNISFEEAVVINEYNLGRK
ncbi:11217_t:CDS:1, partial [Gigaspora margarita]